MDIAFANLPEIEILIVRVILSNIFLSIFAFLLAKIINISKITFHFFIHKNYILI